MTLACDLHGGGRKISRDMRSARPEVDPRRIGAVGYCLGGLMALELARTGAALAAVVGVHSPVSTPGNRCVGRTS